MLKVNRSTKRYKPVVLPQDEAIVTEVIETACNWGYVGYRMVTGIINIKRRFENKKPVNHKRVERIWREEGLKLPKKQQKRVRLFLNDGSCVRLRPERPNHVWSYDFMEDRTMDGRKLRFLNIIDEYRHLCIASIPRRSWRKSDLLEALADAMMEHGVPEYIRSDNGPEFTAKAVREWLSGSGVLPTYIEPGSPWENGFIESFNARMRLEFLNGELFGNLYEAQVLTARWRRRYNAERPHSSLGGRAPQSVIYPETPKTKTAPPVSAASCQ